MTKVWRVGSEADDRLASLGLAAEDFAVSIEAAVSDARTCTGLDAPSARSFIFWTRLNRYFREAVKPREWGATNADQILRALSPNRDFAITAVSGRGGIADPNGKVRTKNPKGSAFAELIKVNNRLLGRYVQGDLLPGLRLVREEPSREPGVQDIPLWILLYRRVGEELCAELSLPTDIKCKSVEDWEERVMLASTPYPGDVDSLDIFRYDEDDDQGPDIAVDWL
ncbi:hypothetical protein F6X68_21545 [Micromonospora sp. AMSO12t]|uniref:hypothetical protein n=1 Tax=Micromonospora sp. AMSO12t TaxID=2650410 RepID=UPI00124B4D7B|nr:hypothetical protein [Micromonospora sp. AMSO12t]KAB1141592.1 hypothetical protein F6X68_21545 [Micromonospora sp. AMSO12t]